MASRIKGITVEIGGDTTGLDKALQQVNTQLRNTQSQLKDVNNLLKLDPKNTELLSQKQKALSDSISVTKSKLDTLKEAQSQLSREDIGTENWDALQREIIETEQNLEQLTREAGNSQTALTKIGQAGATLEAVGGKITAVGSSLTRNVTAPLLAVGTAAAKVTADFDAQMSKVAAISGATGEEFDKLRDKAREMGAKTKFSAKEAGDAFEYMAMAGWKTEDMLDGIEGIMNLAAASGEDLATTSDIVTDALTAFGLQAEDSGHFADLLAAASSNANTNVGMMGETFKYAAPVIGALGGSAEDTAVAVGLMANAGIKASQAGTALRTGLSNLTKPTKQMATYMDMYDIALKTNEDGSLDLMATMTDLREKMGSLSETEKAAAASAIFGKNAMSGWLAIINASDDDFNKLTAAVANCDGEAERMANTMNDNLSGQITILKSALQELAIQVGDTLMPTLRDIVARAQEFVLKLQGMDEETRKTVIQIAAFAAAIGPVLVVIGKLTTGIGVGLQAFSKLGSAISTLNMQAQLGVGAGGKLAAALGSITAPVVAVVAAVAALTAAFVYLWETNEDFRNTMTEIWNGIKENVESFTQGIIDRLNEIARYLGFEDIKDLATTAWKELTTALLDLWNGFCSVLAPIFEGAFKVLSVALKTAFDAITAALDIFIGIFTGDWERAWNGIKDWFKTWTYALFDFVKILFDTIKGAFKAFWEWIGPSWKTGWGEIKDYFVGIWNGIKEFFGGIWKHIKETVYSYLDGIKDAFTSVKEFFKSIGDGILNIFDNVLNGVKGFGDKIADTVKGTFDNVKNKVLGIVDSIKNAFDFEWSLPKLKLPHFKIEGEFSLDPPSVPKIDIDWYGKAMRSGMILNGATIFGAMGNKLLGGGERGAEVVVGARSLVQMIQKAVDKAQEALVKEQAKTIIPMIKRTVESVENVRKAEQMAAEATSILSAIEAAAGTSQAAPMTEQTQITTYLQELAHSVSSIDGRVGNLENSVSVIGLNSNMQNDALSRIADTFGNGMGVYLDGKTLVGQTVGLMDRALGQLAMRRAT